MFHIGRGTKQGDPISTLLFNAVLEEIMKPLKDKWAQKGYGLYRGPNSEGESYLLNLRFADDLLLLATSKDEAIDVLSDFVQAAQDAGLSVHCGKTKVLSNESVAETAQVCGSNVEVLPASGSSAYLGRQLCLTQLHDTEIRHRISRGWAKFPLLKKILFSSSYSLKYRLKLFDQVITPTVLYGSCSWTMTADRCRQLVTTQRRMLRSIIGIPRGMSTHSSESSVEVDVAGISEQEVLEPFAEWMQRCAHAVESHCERLGLESWLTQQRRRYWRWAGHVARCNDGRWAAGLMHWIPVRASCETVV